MRPLFRTFSVLALLTALVPAPAAHADDAGWAAGTFLVAPGVPCPFSGCDVFGSLEVVGGGNDGLGVSQCDFAGHDHFPGTIESEQWGGIVVCNGAFSVYGTIEFARTLTTVTATGDVIVNGSAATMSMELQFLPSSFNPTSTYAVTGVVAFTGGSAAGPAECNVAWQPVGQVCVGIAPGGTEVDRVDVTPPTTTPGTSHHVVAVVDRYRVTLPGGTEVTVPCVVLTVGGAGATCDVLGGTRVDRFLTLYEDDVAEPNPAFAPPVTSVGICATTLRATVEGFGVENAPYLTLC